MTTLYTQQRNNVQKTWMLMATFFVLVIAVGYTVSWYLGSPIILYIAVGFALVMNISGYWYSDKIVLSMTHAKPATLEDNRELYNIVENLAITAGLPMPKVYIVNDPSPNAFATGRDPDHAVIAVTTGLMEILDRTELEGVVAHEMAHIGNRDMLVMTVVVVLAGFIAIVSDILMRAMIFGGGRDNDSKAGGVMLAAGIIGIILAPLAAKLIQMTISRKREFLADASGALLTRYPEGLASALEKISTHTRPMKHASHATAHLFISDPFGGKEKGIMQKLAGLFQTHPPAQERIALLRGMEI